MILGKVRIQNFKSIQDTGWIHLSKGDLINILAGQNESGKTSLLRALNFFQNGEYDTFEDEDRRMEESPRIDCTFYLTDTEYQNLLENTNKKIADYINKNGFTIVRGDTQKDDFTRLSYIYPSDLKTLVEEYNKGLTSTEGQESGNFEPFKYFNEIRPELVFYSSFSDNILPGKATYDEIPKNQAIQDFQNVYGVDFQELLALTTKDNKRIREEERIRKEAADSLNQYWKQTISGEQVEYRYSISIKPDTNTSSSYVNFFINQGDEPQLSIAQKSQGFQWFIGFNLRLRAHQESLDNNGLILLIDEPGQGLHEVAQNDVRNVLEELAKESNIQIIYSTHQPILLGKEDINFNRLLLVDRTKKKGSQFKTISQLVSSNGNKDSLSPVISALGMVSIPNLSKTKINVVSEGITEYFYLKALFGDNFVIIPSSGVDQVPNIFSILLGWGVNSKIVVDDDAQGKGVYKKVKKSFFNDESSDEFKNKVLKIDGYKGIEELLSESMISSILKDYGKKYVSSKTKVENVEQVGKYIFAKTFYDKVLADSEFLDSETIENFKIIQDFLNKK